MRRFLLWTALAGFACAAALAQTDAKLSFEVATVKPAPPPNGGPIMVGFRGGPGTADPGRVSFNFVSLKMLIQNAYNVKPFQITGPGWLDTERYDVTASVPEGTTKEQANIMLQNLLAERFGIELHRETKEFPLYELTVAKNGPKLTAAAAASGSPDLTPPQGPPPIGKDGFPQLSPGKPGAMMMMQPGQMRMMAFMQPVSRLCDMLGSQLGTPVVDKTGLSGNYDFKLTFAPEPGERPAGIPFAPPPPAGDAGPKIADHAGEPGDAPNLFTAVQEQLGLKLEKKKGPLDMLVIDHAEKTPTEN